MPPSEAKPLVFQSLTFQGLHPGKYPPSLIYSSCLFPLLYRHAPLSSLSFKNKMPSVETTFPSRQCSIHLSAPEHNIPQRTFCTHSSIFLLPFTLQSLQSGFLSKSPVTTMPNPVDISIFFSSVIPLAFNIASLSLISPSLMLTSLCNAVTSSWLASSLWPLFLHTHYWPLHFYLAVILAYSRTLSSALFSSISIYSPYITFTFLLNTDDSRIICPTLTFCLVKRLASNCWLDLSTWLSDQHLKVNLFKREHSTPNPSHQPTPPQILFLLSIT